jgi:hypothetical protein
MKINKQNITEKELYAFVKAHYYTDNKTLCQFYEDYDESTIKECIDNDIWALKRFLNIKE